jgi:hypothetical protein
MFPILTKLFKRHFYKARLLISIFLKRTIILSANTENKINFKEIKYKKERNQWIGYPRIKITVSRSYRIST